MYALKNCEGPHRIHGLRSVTAKRRNIKKISDYLLFFDKITIFAYRLTIKIYRIMKRATKNLLIAVTVIVGIICIVNAVWLIVQSGSVAGWFTDYRNIVYGDGAAENGSKIVWRDDVLGWQYFIFYGRLLFGIAFDALLLLFMIKSILALKSGAFFLKSNTYILISAAVCNLLYNFCNENIRILIYDTYKNITDAMLLTPLILFAFSLIYGLAVRVSEENRLTI